MSITEEYKATLDILEAKYNKIKSLIPCDKGYDYAVYESLESVSMKTLAQIKIIKTKIYLAKKGLDKFEIEELINGN